MRRGGLPPPLASLQGRIDLQGLGLQYGYITDNLIHGWAKDTYIQTIFELWSVKQIKNHPKLDAYRLFSA